MTVGDLREVLKSPMLEDRHELLVSFMERTPDEAEAPATGAAVQMAGLRRALVIGTDMAAWVEGRRNEGDGD